MNSKILFFDNDLAQHFQNALSSPSFNFLNNFFCTLNLIIFTAQNGRNVERTTAPFRQPPDEVPRPLEVPYSCRYEGRWYREGEEFRLGPNGCSECVCVDTVVKCNDDNCAPPPTTTTTTTLPPFIEGSRGEQGAIFILNFSQGKDTCVIIYHKMPMHSVRCIASVFSFC